MRLLKRPPCGDLEGDPYEGLTVECERRKGHRGDHRAIVVWPQRVPYVPDPNAPAPTGLHFKPEAWGKLLEHQLNTRLVRPDSFGDTVRIVNRDEEA